MSAASPTALLAEDEAPQRAELKDFLGDLWPDLKLVAECADGTEAKAALEKHRPDVAFLDIRMPGLSGLEVARAAGSGVHIVFITAYDEFAVAAFDNGAADYLVKPVRRDRLETAIERVKQRLALGKPADIGALLDQLEARFAAKRPATLRWITAAMGGVTRMIAVDEVLFFQSQDKYTRVVTADGEAHVRTPLKDLLPQLDPDVFWQVQRGAIVRVSAIRIIQRDEDGKLKLVIRGKAETLPVSAAMAHRFRGM